MIAPDTIPAWLGIPAAIACTIGWLVLEVRAAKPDPYDELTGLDVLERTGIHPHG